MSVVAPSLSQAQDILDHERIQRVLTEFPVRIFIPSEFLASISLEDENDHGLIDRIRGPRPGSVAHDTVGLVDINFYLTPSGDFSVSPSIKVRYKKRRAQRLSRVWSQDFKKAERQAVLRMFKIQRKFMMFKLKVEINPLLLHSGAYREILSDLQDLMVRYRKTCQASLKLKILKMYATEGAPASLPYSTEVWNTWVEGQVFYSWMLREINRYYNPVPLMHDFLNQLNIDLHGISDDEDSLQSEIDAEFEGLQTELFEAPPRHAQRDVDMTCVATKEAQEACCICMENDFSVLPCGHEFHASCLRSQVKYSDECPMCRAKIPTKES